MVSTDIIFRLFYHSKSPMDLQCSWCLLAQRIAEQTRRKNLVDRDGNGGYCSNNKAEIMKKGKCTIMDILFTKNRMVTYVQNQQSMPIHMILNLEVQRHCMHKFCRMECSISTEVGNSMMINHLGVQTEVTPGCKQTAAWKFSFHNFVATSCQNTTIGHSFGSKNVLN